MKSRNIFQRIQLKLKAISTCYNRSDTPPQVTLRVVSSAQTAILHSIPSGKKLMQKKRDGPIQESGAF